jgi:hypothetical protein
MNRTEKIELIEDQIEKLNLELKNLALPDLPLKKVEVEALPNGYLLGIKDSKHNSRSEIFLTEDEGKELVKDLLLGCDDGVFILSPFSRDFASVISEIGKAFG